MSRHLIVGLDPGVKTGFAIWSSTERRLVDVATMSITATMRRVQAMQDAGSLHSVVFEDARLRTGYFGVNASAKQQGAGSIKRDCSIWQEFLEGLTGVPFKPVSPKSKGAKVDAALFVRLTGYTCRTSEHGRDAAMLVVGI